MNARKNFKFTSVEYNGSDESIEISEKDLPWKYSITFFASPKKVIKELRSIADWLEKLQLREN